MCATFWYVHAIRSIYVIHEYFIEHFYCYDMEILALLNKTEKVFFGEALIFCTIPGAHLFHTEWKCNFCLWTAELSAIQQMRKILWLKMRFSAHETYRPIMISKRKFNALSNALGKNFPETNNSNGEKNAEHTQTVITQT